LAVLLCGAVDGKLQAWPEIRDIMSTSAQQIPAHRVTQAIFEYASLISREQQLDELVRLNAVRQQRDSPVRNLSAALCTHVDAWAAGSEQYDDMTVVGLRVRA
jgi:hypothetical protein